MLSLWPALPLDAWRDTRETLHRYTQIIGKIQLALTPRVNHFWNVTLHLTARGLATSALVYDGRVFDIELDFIEHRVVIRTNDGKREVLELRPLAVADFYRELMAVLHALDIRVEIRDRPVEIATDAIPFPDDRMHCAYDRDHVERFFRVLSSAAVVFDEFRSRFIGKCSGVGFYWGTFDFSVGRYCGRRAPDAPATSIMEREGYSHEVSEVGFWPGDSKYGAPAFFALHYPAPEGYSQAAVRPAYASWAEQSHSFVLPYEQVRREPDPSATILEFLQSTYEAGAELARWDRTNLERA